MADKSLFFYLDLVNVLYVPLAIAVAVYANRLYRSLPIGLWGDIAVAFAGVAASTFFLKSGWNDMLLQFNDYAPALFGLAYMPVVAFVAIGFARSLVPLFPAHAAQPAMAMAAAGPTVGSLTTPPTTAPISSATVADTPVPSAAGPAVHDASPIPPPPDSKLKKWIKLGVSVALLILVALVALGKFVTRNDLPGCDAQQTREVLATIFEQQNAKAKRYDTAKTVSTSADLIACAASVTWMDDAHSDLEYSIARQEGGKFLVKITSAHDK